MQKWRLQLQSQPKLVLQSLETIFGSSELQTGLHDYLIENNKYKETTKTDYACPACFAGKMEIISCASVNADDSDTNTGNNIIVPESAHSFTKCVTVDKEFYHYDDPYFEMEDENNETITKIESPYFEVKANETIIMEYSAFSSYNDGPAFLDSTVQSFSNNENCKTSNKDTPVYEEKSLQMDRLKTSSELSKMINNTHCSSELVEKNQTTLQRRYVGRNKNYFHFRVKNDDKMHQKVLRKKSCRKSKFKTNASKLNKFLVCNMCGKSFATRPGLYLHCRKHKDGYQFECDTCSRKFMDKQTLKEHLQTHMEVKPFLCQTCGKHFSRNSRLKKHLMKHNLTKVKPKPYYTCSHCQEVFCNEANALNHAKEGHEKVNELHFIHGLIDKVFLCEYCENCFSTHEALNCHRSKHVGLQIFSCSTCKSSFPTFSRLQTHKIMHTAKFDMNDTSTGFDVPKYYACHDCDKSYLHWTNLSVHWKLQHAKIKYMYHCKLCPAKFPSSWTLTNHCKKEHSEIGLKTYKRSNKCKLCLQLFATSMELKKHMNECHSDYEEPRYLCETCGKVFKQKASLEPHIRSHKGMSQHKCKLCDKYFVHQSSLSSHLRLHRGDKRHRCQFCEKAFFQLGDRINHERKHTGERPYVCEECGKAFRTRGMWFEHSRIHKDERPFPCDICGAAFRRSYALKNHKTIHTGEKNYVCAQCDHAFRVKQDMQKHIVTYHKKK